jgi:hypothetical protein
MLVDAPQRVKLSILLVNMQAMLSLTIEDGGR